MFEQSFYNRSIRKYIILFGTLFNNIYVNRVQFNEKAKSLDVQQTLKVPLTYGPKQKYFQRTNSDVDLNQPFATIFPRMSFEMVGFNYAPERANNSLNRHRGVNNGAVSSMYEPSPWDIDFTLYIAVHHAEDATQIIEQILPYFRPEWTTTIELSEDMKWENDVKLNLRSVSMTDTYEGDMNSRRVQIWTATFNMKAWLLQEVRNHGGGDGSGLIKRVQLDFHSVPNQTPMPPIPVDMEPQEIIHVQPGLTATGEPTSNINNSIPWNLIGPDDDYGFIIDYFKTADD